MHNGIRIYVSIEQPLYFKVGAGRVKSRKVTYQKHTEENETGEVEFCKERIATRLTRKRGHTVCTQSVVITFVHETVPAFTGR